VSETPVKHKARVFEMASPSGPNCKQVKRKRENLKKNKRKQNIISLRREKRNGK